jgi:hypothetical protein
MEIKAFLNPNPVLHGETLIDPWGVKYGMKNEPFLEIELCNFPKGEYDIQLLTPFMLDKKVEVTSNCFSVYFLDKKFEDQSISEVKVEVKGKEVIKECTLPTRFHKVSGKIRNFDGKPASGYVWMARENFVEHEIITKSDKEGNFTLYCSEGRRLRVFVADTSYGKTTLECWIMADELKSDIEINPHIGGNLELYELKAWFLWNVWNVFFIPAIVSTEIPPKLKKEDLRIWINEEKVEIKKFTPHKVYFKGEKKDEYYPAYIISGVTNKPLKEVCSPIIVMAQIISPEKGEGEAWYIYYHY